MKTTPDALAALIGQRVDLIDTPALVVDLDAMHRNIQRMADFARKHGSDSDESGRGQQHATRDEERCVSAVGGDPRILAAQRRTRSIPEDRVSGETSSPAGKAPAGDGHADDECDHGAEEFKGG